MRPDMFWPVRFGLLAVGLALGPLGSWAQAPKAAANPPRTRLDTVGRRAVARLARPRVVAFYDARYSIINGHFGTIAGLKLGLEWKSRLRTGAAVYFLSSRIPTRRARHDDIDDARADLRFRYLALYGEYVLLETRRWELTCPCKRASATPTWSTSRPTGAPRKRRTTWWA